MSLLPPSGRILSAFFEAIRSLRLRQISLILNSGYDPNLLVNVRGQNGLQYLVRYFGSAEAARLRLQVPINRVTYLNIGRLLLDSGVDPNSIDLVAGETVIFDAIRLNEREMVALLLSHVDLAVRNKDGETALMCAARFGSRQVLRMLLDHLRHLDLDVYFLRHRNNFGLSTLDLARAENRDCFRALTKYLIDFGLHHDLRLAAVVGGGSGCGRRRSTTNLTGSRQLAPTSSHQSHLWSPPLLDPLEPLDPIEAQVALRRPTRRLVHYDDDSSFELEHLPAECLVSHDELSADEADYLANLSRSRSCTALNLSAGKAATRAAKQPDA